jgi:ring-1,2-phenylacetyl-CoA epoxidase subunit PaaC
MDPALTFTWLLRQGDNTLILAQLLCKLCGKGPALEEDLALSNVALDLLGQTRMWLGHAAAVEGRGRTEDHLAFLRDSHQMHNCLLVEQPNGDYGHTMMRQFYFDSWHYLFLRDLQASADAQVAAIAAKALKEVGYHLRRSADLVVRLGDGTPESHQRMQAAADALWMYSGEMFIADDVDRAMAQAGIAPDIEALRPQFLDHVAGVFADATLDLPPADAWMQRGGKQGRHSEHLGYILAEMQFLQRAYPGAQW